MPPPSPSPASDAFALAAARLNGQRPLRDPRLQQIATVMQAGLWPTAQAQLADCLRKQPRDADALWLAARVAQRLGDRDAALALLARCLDSAPAFAAARYQRARWLAEDAAYAEALADAQRLLADDERNPLFRQLQADLLEATGDGEQALALCEQLAEEHAGRAESWVRLGHALRGLGRAARAIEAYRHAIACKPGLGAAWWALANMKTLRFDAAELAALQAQLARRDLATDDRTALSFALAKGLEDAGDPAQAFTHYDQANAALRKRIHYDPATLTQGVAASRAVFTPAFFSARAGWGHPSAAPIFILGRPRSGSTLVEQILASHPAVEATAELPYVTALAARLGGERVGGPAYGMAYLPPLAAMGADAVRALGEAYLQQAAAHQRLGRPMFIDKKPANFAHIGLIHLMLPNAKIIDVRRHPAGCGWSIFRSYVSAGQLRLDELGRFYRDYVTLMAHFDAVLPGRIHRVVYEDLVRDQEGETRRLLDFLGLPFDAACLRFHETERSILTPSSEQVRQPITGTAVDHWRHFEPWLGPLIDSLGSAHAAYPAVPADLLSPVAGAPPAGAACPGR